MEWQKFYIIHTTWDIEDPQSGRSWFDAFDLHTGELVGTFDDEGLAVSLVEELYKIKIEEIEKLLLGR